MPHLEEYSIRIILSFLHQQRWIFFKIVLLRYLSIFFKNSSFKKSFQSKRDGSCSICAQLLTWGSDQTRWQGNQKFCTNSSLDFLQFCWHFPVGKIHLLTRESEILHGVSSAKNLNLHLFSVIAIFYIIHAIVSSGGNWYSFQSIRENSSIQKSKFQIETWIAGYE